MLITDWTIDQRMRFPDWCFGNRQLIGVYSMNNTPGTITWEISEIALPEPACIWVFGYQWLWTTGAGASMRVGLADVVPTNVGEMDAAMEILPYFGQAATGPNYIGCKIDGYAFLQLEVRKGMSTGGRKLVMQNNCTAGISRIFTWVTISMLPTDMAGWLAHNKI